MRHTVTGQSDTPHRSPAAEHSASRSSTSASVEFMDNRPEAVAQRRLVDAIHTSSDMVAQQRQLHGMFGEAAQLMGGPEEELLQGKLALVQRAVSESDPAPRKNHTGLPDHLKSGIESISGLSMDGVTIHYNSAQPAQLNALAYTQGADIHVAPGQEQYLPHEAWHVVQQAQGRVQPTMQLKDGVPVNDDQGLEHEADVMGGKATQVWPEHATGWGGIGGSVVQRKPSDFNGIIPTKLRSNIIFTPPLWTSVVKAIEAYTKTIEQDVYTQEERIEALDKAVHQWKEDFDRRLENGSKPSDREKARLAIVSDIFTAIDRERKEHQSSREQQRQSNTVSKKGGEGPLVKCYRGMFYTHPQFADAKKGIVRPMSSSDRGATFDTENTNYTAWDNKPTQPAAIATGHPRLWAIDHRDNGKLKYDLSEPVGVVLEFECSATEYTRMNEGEYQIQGEIQADRVHALYPDMNIVKFQEDLSVVREPINKPFSFPNSLESISKSEPRTYKDEATQALDQMKDWTHTQLDRERKWLMIKMRTSSIYDPDQKKSMIAKLEKEYGIKY